jgi:hypothetical protein
VLHGSDGSRSGGSSSSQRGGVILRGVPVPNWLVPRGFWMNLRGGHRGVDGHWGGRDGAVHPSVALWLHNRTPHATEGGREGGRLRGREREREREREGVARVSSIGTKPHVRVCHPVTTKTMSTSHANAIQMGKEREKGGRLPAGCPTPWRGCGRCCRTDWRCRRQLRLEITRVHRIMSVCMV